MSSQTLQHGEDRERAWIALLEGVLLLTEGLSYQGAKD